MMHLLSRSSVLFLLAVCLFLGSCTHKEETTSSNDWPEMDSFHMIMAESYHPLKDSANLEPAKANAELLATEAEKWAAAALTDKVNTEEMQAMVAKLKVDTRAFADQVKSGASSEELTASMTALHEGFHHIQEAWERGHEEPH